MPVNPPCVGVAEYPFFDAFDTSKPVCFVTRYEGDTMVARGEWKMVKVGKKKQRRYVAIAPIMPSNSPESARDITVPDMLANVGICEDFKRERRAKAKIQEWGMLRRAFIAGVTVEMANIPEVLVAQIAA